MSLDQPQSSAAFWAIYNATGIRPEFLIPVLSYESGLNPSVPNSQGTPYYGIGQNSSDLIQQQTGLSPAEYLTKPASYQLQNVVLPYFNDVVRKYGSLTSGTRVYQAEFMPASLAYAPGLDDVITKAPAREYTDNAVFDTQRKGTITPRDLAAAVASQVPHPAVQKAIADAYAYAPSMGPPQDPVYGSTGIRFTPAVTAAVAIGILGTAAAAAYLLAPEAFGLPAFAGVRENPANDLAERPSMQVQSLLFPRDRWTKPEARAWLKEHGYKSKKVDETDRYYRFRQRDPDEFTVLRTKDFGENIKAIVGR